MAHISSAIDSAADSPTLCPAAGSHVTVAPLDGRNSDVSTAQTVALMADAVRRCQDSPVLHSALRSIADELGARPTPRDIAAAVFAYVKRRVRFVEDADLVAACWPGQPRSSEVLIEPDALLSMAQPAGDCDDFSMLVCALLRGLGVDCELVTVAADAEQPERWSHVYAYALLPDGRLSMDASHGDRPGWEAPRVYRRAVWPLTPPLNTLHGLDGVGAVGWGGILNRAVDSSLNVFEARYGGPRPGLYQQTGPDGSSVTFRQQPGASSFSFPTSQISPAAGGDLMIWALGGLIVIGGLAMLGGRR